MQRKLSEMQDLPRDQKVVVYGKGSLVGEEDLLGLEDQESFVRSGSLVCVSERGKLLRMTRDQFLHLQHIDTVWNRVLKTIEVKKGRQRMDYVKAKPKTGELTR